MHTCVHIHSHSPYSQFLFLSLPSFLSSPPLCEFGHAVCMQICRMEDPHAQYTHTHSQIEKTP